MAGRKSQASSPSEQERFLPIANVGRIMKKSVPASAKISKEAKETVQECVSEFISFITGEASDKCHREKRKTINGDDLLWAMTTLGFQSYVGPLKLHLSKYRETEGDANSAPKQDQEDPHIANNGGSVFSQSHGFYSPAKPFHLAGIGIGDAHALAPQLHQW